MMAIVRAARAGLSLAIERLDSAAAAVPRLLDILLGLRPPSPALDVGGSSGWIPTDLDGSSPSPKEEGFLFAVPKQRRTIEKRLNRKYGVPGQFWKPLVPKNLLVCNTCGHAKEPDALCPHCYDRIKTETREMQDKIQAELGLSPIESEVVVVYEGERTPETVEFHKGKRIVEMKKERPPWFTENLLQKTTRKPSSSTDVKPTELA